MIAMKGASDDEIAEMLGCSRDAFAKWRAMYPKFNEAIEKGRTLADVNVVASLYKQTQGYKYEEEAATPKGGIVTIERYAKPDTQAIKYWLDNRQSDMWRTASTSHLAGGARASDTPVGIKVESRAEIIESICMLIASKPDGNNKPDTAQTKKTT